MSENTFDDFFAQDFVEEEGSDPPRGLSERDPNELIESAVPSSLGSIEYYHCGPQLDSTEHEMLLLHGAAFTKEDWKRSGILSQLCGANNNEGKRFSVTALDLPVSATGDDLESVFDGLVKQGVLSGQPVVVVTPSASGRSVVTLLDDESAVSKVLAGWIPVAPAMVSQSPDDVFDVLIELSIPVLAIYGDRDSFGEQVTNKLVRVANARDVELEGGHPVYLDSPDEFVEEMLKFLDGVGTTDSINSYEYAYSNSESAGHTHRTTGISVVMLLSSVLLAWTWW